jgi:hypothetical protein
LIAKDARKNLGGTEVVSVGSVFAREIQGVQCYAVVAIVPDQDGKDWVPSEVILDTAQNYLAASINRLALIAALEDVFARVQVFGTELAHDWWQPAKPEPETARGPAAHSLI